MPRPPTIPTRVRVRMYRHGLGDCFLLTFSSRASSVHVLIDCGVLKATQEPRTKMTRVAENVRQVTGGHLDLLVATHQHWDHLSGFHQAREVFSQITVGEVWLAWTEDPRDRLAAELRRRREEALRGVAAAARKLDGAGATAAQPLNALLGFHGDLGAGNTPSTAEAVAWIKRRAARPPRYLRPGEVRALPGVTGIRAFVLGPPHDRRLIKRSDPSTVHSEVYELAGDRGADAGFMAAAEALESGSTPDEQPFHKWFRISEPDARKHRFFARRYAGRENAWRQIEHDWLGVAGRLALQLDSDTNNTSLVLAFELRDGRVLLFPGDAQVGNWLSWEPLEWTVRDKGRSRTVTTKDLLARTVLYKVGHHGSHNATLREKGLELMTSRDLAAMIPVNRPMARKMAWLMPFPSLYRRLNEKTSGRILDAERGIAAKRPKSTSAEDWRRFTARTSVQPGWIDYTLEL